MIQLLFYQQDDKKILDISQNNKTKIIYSDDLEANWTIKNKIPYYGYKLNMASDTAYGFIAEGYITPASNSDMNEFPKILNINKLNSGSKVFADNGFVDKIMYKTNRKSKLDEIKSKINSKISKVRGKIEEIFGNLKQGYSFFRFKYLRIQKTNTLNFYTQLWPIIKKKVLVF